MPDGKNGFGHELRVVRKQRGLSLRRCAELAGISPTYLSKIETGDMPPPSEETLRRLAAVLLVDRDALMLASGKLPSDLAGLLLKQSVNYVKALRAELGSRDARDRPDAGFLLRAEHREGEIDG